MFLWASACYGKVHDYCADETSVANGSGQNTLKGRREVYFSSDKFIYVLDNMIIMRLPFDPKAVSHESPAAHVSSETVMRVTPIIHASNPSL